MKIRRNYHLFINSMTRMAFWGGTAFNYRISQATLGELYDCSLTELKNNIKLLKNNGFTVSQQKY